MLTVIPLVTMPSIFAYAWYLLATNPHPLIRETMHLIGWNSPGFEPLHAAWVFATWLWPIPALIMVAGFKHLGAGAYRLACVDASAIRAFLFGALPVMRGPLIAACAIVFILSAIDSTVPPLVGAFDVWSQEMKANAELRQSSSFMIQRSWPAPVAMVLLGLLAFPGLRQMAAWADDDQTRDTGENPLISSVVWGMAFVLVAAVTLFPIVVFIVEMQGGRGTTGETFRAALWSVWSYGRATLVVAVCTALAAAALGITMIEEPSRPGWRRMLGHTAVGLVLVTAVLPPSMIGATLASFYSNELISPREHWNIYDNTPLTWITAMLARFAFIPVCLMVLLNRRVPDGIIAQATTDGADRIQRLAHARLPRLWLPLTASALIVACLTLSEVAAGVLVQPPQWSGGSLAVYVDSEMHYGRRNQTIAMSIMMMAPAVLAALLLPFLVKLSGRKTIHGRGASEKNVLPLR